MNATLQSKNETNRYQFLIEHDGQQYDVVIYTNQKGKFIDEEISLNGNELDGEGTEGDIREKITNYLDKNWDNLVK